MPFLPTFIFLNMAYSQNEKQVLEIKFFSTAQPWPADFQKMFQKFLPWILHFGGDIYVTFLRKNVKDL